tara:strand:+ start:859 stop:1068 length:210 start_codon:yes stop_codon:yes gene_type:complete
MELMLGEYLVKVFLCEDEFWKHDSIFIYNNSKCVSEREINCMIDYLFSEGFIRDRRTKFYISERDQEEE